MKEFPRSFNQVRRHGYWNITWSGMLTLLKMRYDQYYVNYNGSKKGHKLNEYYHISFSVLELSILFKLRYLKAVFCKMYLKGSSIKFSKMLFDLSFDMLFDLTCFLWKPTE